jgi:hypothetical protein
MKQTLLIITALMLMLGCEDSDNLVSGANEVDVDWCLVKTPNMSDHFDDDGSSVYVEGTGYFFYFINSSNITDLSIQEHEEEGLDYLIFENNDGILSFSYNGENFSFDLSDSYISSFDRYLVKTEYGNLQRIIYNEEMNYFTLFWSEGFFGIELNSSSPNELIDYR